MPIPQTLQALTQSATQAANEDAQTQARREARAAWAKQRIAAYEAAQRRADDAWRRIVEENPDAPD